MTGLNRRDWLRGAGAAGLLGALQGGVRESGAAVPHFAPRARRVVYLFQSGGPSQVDLWDYKPGLRRLHGTDLPASVKGTQRVTGMTARQKNGLPLAPSKYKFTRHTNNDRGVWISELLPHTASAHICTTPQCASKAGSAAPLGRPSANMRDRSRSAPL